MPIFHVALEAHKIRAAAGRNRPEAATFSALECVRCLGRQTALRGGGTVHLDKMLICRRAYVPGEDL